MKNPRLLFFSIVNSLGVLLYVSAVVLIMQNGQKLFGPSSGFLGSIAILMLFVVSAAITGLLVFGRPIYFYLIGSKIEAITLLFYTIGWLVLITLILLITLYLIR